MTEPCWGGVSNSKKKNGSSKNWRLRARGGGEHVSIRGLGGKLRKALDRRSNRGVDILQKGAKYLDLRKKTNTTTRRISPAGERARGSLRAGNQQWSPT